jgi:glycerol-1-phosphate dehydrogenase [NAD(P)+]
MARQGDGRHPSRDRQGAAPFRPDDLFGRTFVCPCGKTHAIEPREVHYGDDAPSRLPEVCGRAASGRAAAVVMDARTRAAAGAAVAAALRQAGWQADEVVLSDRPDGASPVCDDDTMRRLRERLGPAAIVVTVGSGVITDLGKWAAFERGIPFVAVATAASMNGYASANVAPTVGGLKTLLRARPPAAVLASPRVLADAPHDLTAAGLGDVLAKATSSLDWRANRLLFDDYFCERSVGLVADLEPLYLEHPEDIRARRPRAVRALFDALLLTGVAMTMAESSAPASGGEHLVSHALDMMSALDGRPHDLHGRQVGVGTVLAADLWRRVLAVESPALADAPAAVDEPFWGRLAPAVAEEYAAKAERLRCARADLTRRWDDLRAALAPEARSPDTIRDCLNRAGAACRAEDIRCSRARLLAAFRHAHEIRSRFTVLDLAHLVGVLPRAAGEMLEQLG